MYLCAKDGEGALSHVESSPGVSRWVCPNGDWDCSDTTAAVCLGSDPPNTELALALEAYAAAHEVVITDNNVVAISAQVAPAGTPVRDAREAAAKEAREAAAKEAAAKEAAAKDAPKAEPKADELQRGR
jgi:hypothetical protein